LQALAFRAINTVRARGRSALGISCGIFGNGFAVRASVLQAVPYSAFSIAEDLEYHIALVRNGYRVVYTGDAEMTGAGASGRAAVAQRSRWEGGRLRVARESIFPLLGQVIRGRVRLFEPTLDLLSLPMAFAVFLLLMCFLVPVLPLKLYAVAALCLLAFHVLIAITASPSPRSALNLLVRVPFYIVWKVALVPRILAKSRRNTTWDRSVRSASPVQPAAQVQDNRIS
jgi:cellulose synthase/poly-beta-1,6-N-acetylglucosamine synthase-like glycosyltransferase